MARQPMPRRRVRQIITIILLALALAVIAGLYLNWQASRNIGIDLSTLAGSQAAPPPQFLYAFSGAQANPLKAPTGVFVDGDRVVVSDAAKSQVYIFRLDGTPLLVFGQGKVKTPLYIAKNPKTGDYWISDRGTHSIHIFTSGGIYKGDFDPNLPKDQRPTFKTNGVQMEPLALTFTPDGSLYVTDILKTHRYLVFDPAGKFVRSVGTGGMVLKITDGPGVLQFPNSIKVHQGKVYIADSNNRRVQVFDEKTASSSRSSRHRVSRAVLPSCLP